MSDYIKNQLVWIGFGRHLASMLRQESSAPLGALDVYVGNREEQLVQYVIDAVEESTVPNKILLEDLKDVTQKWTEMDITAQEAVNELLGVLYEYCEFGC